MIIHRVIDDFVLQFGDPTGTGAGGSPLGNFDDQFHPDLQHNNPGGISWAKSTDDTNNSQVFVIDVPTRFLDFNHSYFGQLTEGDAVRDAITATATDAGNRPVFPIYIDSVTIFEDTENAVVMLRAMATSGEADITVTVTDEDGNQYVETFRVTVAPDPFNSGPYLEDIPLIETVSNVPATFQLSAIDVEGDPVLFDGVKVGTVDYAFSVNSQTGQVVVTPPTDFVGSMELLVRVRPEGFSDRGDLYDTQRVTILVTPPAPSTVALLPISDSGTYDDDQVTNLTSLSFDVTGVLDGALVRLYHNDNVLGQAIAGGSSVVISTSLFTALGDGTYEIRATQIAEGLESALSSALQVTIDTTPPPRSPRRLRVRDG
jgi:large repetitive protein